MKNTFQKTFLAFVFLLVANFVMAQVPQGIPYQAVARDNAGNLIKNQPITLRFKIHDGTANGAVVYSETHSVTTDALGLFSVNIGGGTSTSTLADVNWGSGAKFTQVALDVTGGSNFIDMGTTQMMSVPYALYAGSSAAATSVFQATAADDNNISNVNSGNVGIGTDDPHAKLDVNGSLKVHQDLDVGNNLTVYDNLTVFGVLNGMRVGNIGTTYGNTVFGAGAMEAMNNDSAGALNVAVGKQALSFNTDGSNNNAIGSNALQHNTTGSENVALGNQTLFSNTSGSQNTAIGYAASSLGNLNNTTAIGANAIVDASNKIQLGNASVTSVNTNGTYTGAGFKTPNGTSSQILMADGSSIQIVRGFVNYDGSLIGNGFTASRIMNYNPNISYNISFSTPFSSVPIVLVNGKETNSVAVISNITATGFKVYFKGADPYLIGVNTNFGFIAMTL